ncbi:MAG: hypothetical protein ACR5KV_01235 [Wolbachia sp.]
MSFSLLSKYDRNFCYKITTREGHVIECDMSLYCYDSFKTISLEYSILTDPNLSQIHCV